MPKVVKGGTLWAFWKSNLLRNIKKIEGGSLETINYFRKKASQSQNNEHEQFFSQMRDSNPRLYASQRGNFS